MRRAPFVFAGDCPSERVADPPRNRTDVAAAQPLGRAESAPARVLHLAPINGICRRTHPWLAVANNLCPRSSADSEKMRHSALIAPDTRRRSMPSFAANGRPIRTFAPVGLRPTAKRNTGCKLSTEFHCRIASACARSNAAAAQYAGANPSRSCASITITSGKSCARCCVNHAIGVSVSSTRIRSGCCGRRLIYWTSRPSSAERRRGVGH